MHKNKKYILIGSTGRQLKVRNNEHIQSYRRAIKNVYHLQFGVEIAFADYNKLFNLRSVLVWKLRHFTIFHLKL